MPTSPPTMTSAKPFHRKGYGLPPQRSHPNHPLCRLVDHVSNKNGIFRRSTAQEMDFPASTQRKSITNQSYPIDGAIGAVAFNTSTSDIVPTSGQSKLIVEFDGLAERDWRSLQRRIPLPLPPRTTNPSGSIDPMELNPPTDVSWWTNSITIIMLADFYLDEFCIQAYLPQHMGRGTAYYSTVELLVEFSNRHIQRRRIGPGFR